MRPSRSVLNSSGGAGFPELGVGGSNPSSRIPTRFFIRLTTSAVRSARGVLGQLPHPVDLGNLRGRSCAQGRLFALAVGQRGVHDPTERLDPGALQVGLQAIGLLNGCGLGPG